LLSEYTMLCVNEHLGLTFPEYLTTNRLIREQYVIFLNRILEEKDAKLNELREQQRMLDNDLKGV